MSLDLKKLMQHEEDEDSFIQELSQQMGYDITEKRTTLQDTDSLSFDNLHYQLKESDFDKYKPPAEGDSLNIGDQFIYFKYPSKRKETYKGNIIGHFVITKISILNEDKDEESEEEDFSFFDPDFDEPNYLVTYFFENEHKRESRTCELREVDAKEFYDKFLNDSDEGFYMGDDSDAALYIRSSSSSQFDELPSDENIDNEDQFEEDQNNDDIVEQILSQRDVTQEQEESSQEELPQDFTDTAPQDVPSAPSKDESYYQKILEKEDYNGFPSLSTTEIVSGQVWLLYNKETGKAKDAFHITGFDALDDDYYVNHKRYYIGMSLKSHSGATAIPVFNIFDDEALTTGSLNEMLKSLKESYGPASNMEIILILDGDGMSFKEYAQNNVPLDTSQDFEQDSFEASQDFTDSAPQDIPNLREEAVIEDLKRFIRSGVEIFEEFDVVYYMEKGGQPFTLDESSIVKDSAGSYFLAHEDKFFTFNLKAYVIRSYKGSSATYSEFMNYISENNITLDDPKRLYSSLWNEDVHNDSSSKIEVSEDDFAESTNVDSNYIESLFETKQPPLLRDGLKVGQLWTFSDPFNDKPKIIINVVKFENKDSPVVLIEYSYKDMTMFGGGKIVRGFEEIRLLIEPILPEGETRDEFTI